MAKYQFVRVWLTMGRIYSTDPQLSDWILGEIRKIMPSCTTRHEEYDLHGDLIGFGLHKLEGKDGQVLHQVLRMLLNIGFEPFSTSSEVVHERPMFVDLRRKVE